MKLRCLWEDRGLSVFYKQLQFQCIPYYPSLNTLSLISSDVLGGISRHCAKFELVLFVFDNVGGQLFEFVGCSLSRERMVVIHEGKLIKRSLPYYLARRRMEAKKWAYMSLT